MFRIFQNRPPKVGLKFIIKVIYKKKVWFHGLIGEFKTNINNISLRTLCISTCGWKVRIFSCCWFGCCTVVVAVIWNYERTDRSFDEIQGYSGSIFAAHQKFGAELFFKIGTFSCENEDQISEFQGLRNGFSEKLEKIKMKNCFNFYLKKIRKMN